MICRQHVHMVHGFVGIEDNRLRNSRPFTAVTLVISPRGTLRSKSRSSCTKTYISRVVFRSYKYIILETLKPYLN